MSATLEREETRTPATNGRPRSRAQVAEELIGLLTVEPQSEAALRRQLKGLDPGTPLKSGKDDAVKAALGVLEAQHKIRRIPNTAGSSLGGWVLTSSAHESAIIDPQEIKFPYEYVVAKVDEMFIDEEYQRPLTSFVDRITSRFNPLLVQTLAINDRGNKGNKGRRYAIIDGQTRWAAATRIGIVSLPCVMFKGLSPEEEADIFWQLQKERKGMVSWHRFRAALKAQRPEALAINNLVQMSGYELGDGLGQVKAIAALEATYRKDEFMLERTLMILKATWPDEVPDSTQIRGLHHFLRSYPIGQHGHQEVDDERLIRRLKTAGPASLTRKAIAAREAHATGRGSAAQFMGLAIQGIYQAGGRSQ